MLLNFRDYENTFTYKLGKKFYFYLLTFLDSSSLKALRVFYESFLSLKLNNNTCTNTKFAGVKYEILSEEINYVHSNLNFNNVNSISCSSILDISADSKTLFLKLQANIKSSYMSNETAKMLIKHVTILQKKATNQNY